MFLDESTYFCVSWLSFAWETNDSELTSDALRSIEARWVKGIAIASLLPAAECVLDAIDVPLAFIADKRDSAVH